MNLEFQCNYGMLEFKLGIYFIVVLMLESIFQIFLYLAKTMAVCFFLFT